MGLNLNHLFYQVHLPSTSSLNPFTNFKLSASIQTVILNLFWIQKAGVGQVPVAHTPFVLATQEAEIRKIMV
jgi:hypothetical protein